MNAEKEEKLIRELMGKSAAKMPFRDFEDQLMQQIYEEAKTSRSFLTDVKLSWFFFVVGTLFGLFLNILVGEMNKTIFGFPAQRLSLILQVLFVILILLQFDKLVALTKKSVNHFKNSEKQTSKKVYL